MKLNVPNLISLSRFVIAPVFYFFATSGSRESLAVACFLFLVGALTDYFDGYIARKYSIITLEGKFFDPLADKFLTTAAFIVFVQMSIIPLWLVLILIVRDFGTTFLRIYADKEGINLKTSLSAKWKTFLQMLFIAIILILLFLKSTLLYDYGGIIDSIIYSDITYISMIALTAFSILTAIEYIIQNYSLLWHKSK